jgi:hypothetical protein
MPTRIWIESLMALLTGILAVVTVVNPEWIEWLFRVSPDGGGGALERSLVGVFAAASCASAVLAHRSVRRRHLATATP